MANPSPRHSITLRVAAPTSFNASSDLVAAVASTGAALTPLDVVESTQDSLIIDISCDTRDADHAQQVSQSLEALDGVAVHKSSDRTFLLHLGGKLESTPKVPLRNRDNLSRAYTPGVVRVCQAIADNPEEARRLTIERNTVAVVTDGSAVLGLGNIGPEASMPVMKGKAVLFKQFADVDAWPVALDTQDTEEIIAVCKALAPAYGGINLEDISAPRSFEIEDIVVCGRDGVLDKDADHKDPHRAWLAQNTNPNGVTGSLKAAVGGSDVFIGVSAPDLLDGDDIATMDEDAIVFAMSNPNPEVDPLAAGKHAAIVATGRSDYPNQINNVLAFPGFFRGLLDAKAVEITDAMLVAAADAIAPNVAEAVSDAAR